MFDSFPLARKSYSKVVMNVFWGMLRIVAYKWWCAHLCIRTGRLNTTGPASSRQLNDLGPVLKFMKRTGNVPKCKVNALGSSLSATCPSVMSACLSENITFAAAIKYSTLPPISSNRAWIQGFCAKLHSQPLSMFCFETSS